MGFIFSHQLEPARHAVTDAAADAITDLLRSLDVQTKVTRKLVAAATRGIVDLAGGRAGESATYRALNDLVSVEGVFS